MGAKRPENPVSNKLYQKNIFRKYDDVNVESLLLVFITVVDIGNSVKHFNSYQY